MNNVGWLLVAVVVAYGCAAIAPLLRSRSRSKLAIIASWCPVPILFACPLLIPPANVGLRAASITVSTDIFFRMVDYSRHWDHLDHGTVLREYYRFLIPFPVFSVVYPKYKRRLLRPEDPWPQLVRLVGGIAGITAALLALKALSGIAMIRSSFALNHAAMLFTFVLAIESLSRALCGLERLAGFDATPIVRNAYLSRTVSEFWQRYNNRVHDWFFRSVFIPTGGRRVPARSMLLVFLASGVLHEVTFAIATSRLTGYQLAFFTIQGPAALASGRLERLARRGGITGKVVAHGSTILFVGITSVLFFDGVGKVFPFLYASTSPLP